MSIMSGMRRPNRSPSNPKMKAPERAHHQGQRDRERDRGNALAEIGGDLAENESDQEKIERIERPAEETRDECVSLFPGERFEQPERFHALNFRPVPRKREISNSCSSS
jgi:hypothetical protein